MGKFQAESMRTRPSGSGKTCALAGKKTKGNELCPQSKKNKN